MDLILISLIILYIIVLVIVIVLNYNHVKLDADGMFKALSERDPKIISFCMGRDKKSGLYHNYYVTPETDKTTRSSNLVKLVVGKFPVDFDGTLIQNVGYEQGLTTNHLGTITDLDNGFIMTGFNDDTPITCPSNYFGPDCERKSKAGEICVNANNDSEFYNKIHPLTNEQFLSLDMYGVSNDYALSDDILEKRFPRAGIQCFNDGRAYKLITCRSDQIFNENMQCVPYDICTEELDNYRHTRPISADAVPLKDDEYYVCRNSKSVLQTCTSGTIFDEVTRQCSESHRCVDKPNGTHIYLNEKQYIECQNFAENLIDCEYGVNAPTSIQDDNNGIATGTVIDGDNKLVCNDKPCVDKIYTYDDKVLEFAYGIRRCVNNVPEIILCNTDPSPNRFKTYKWGEEFKYEFKAYPTEVLDMEHMKCVVPGDATADFRFKADAVDQFKWSSVMLEEHPFNPVTSQFYCMDQNIAYRVDYLNQSTVPPLSDMFVLDASQPCVNEKLNYLDEPFLSIDPERLPLNLPIMYGIRCDADENLWPRYDGKNYIGAVVKIDVKLRLLTKIIYTDSIPPHGFKIKDFSNPIGPLSLIGYKDLNLDYGNLKKHTWYFANFTHLSPLMFSPDSQKRSLTYNLPTKINSRVDIDATTKKNELWFGILWVKIMTDIIVSSKPEVIITSHGISFDTGGPQPQMITKSFRLVHLEYINDSVVKISYGDISIQIPHFEINLP